MLQVYEKWIEANNYSIVQCSLQSFFVNYDFFIQVVKSIWNECFLLGDPFCSESVLSTLCALCPKLPSSLCLMVILTVKVLPKPNLFKESNSNELLLQCNTDNKFIQKITSTCCYFIRHASTMKTYLMDNFGKL